MNVISRPACIVLLAVAAGCDSGPVVSVLDKPDALRLSKTIECDTVYFPKTSDVDALAGGVWTGDLFNCARHITYEGITALVSEDGRFRIIGDNGHLLSGVLQTDGDTFRGDGRDFAPAGVEYFSGPTTHLFLDGSVQERSLLVGRWGTEWGDYGYFTFNYQQEWYETRVTLDDLAGVWPTYYGESIEGTWTVEPDGRFNGQDRDGCLHSGEFSVIDERYSIVSIELAITGCSLAGSWSGLANRTKPADWWEWSIDVSVDDGTYPFRILLLQ